MAKVYVPPHLRQTDHGLVKVEGYFRAGPGAEALRIKPAVKSHPATDKGVLDARFEATHWLSENLGAAADLLPDLMAQKSVRDMLAAYENELNNLRHAPKDQMNKSSQIWIGREWGRFADLLRAARFFARLKSGNINSDEVVVERDYLISRMAGKGGSKVFGKPGSYPIVVQALAVEVEQRAQKFLEEEVLTKHFPEGLESQSQTDLVAYIQANHIQPLDETKFFVPHMTHDEAVDWIKAYLGVPMKDKYGDMDGAQIHDHLKHKAQQRAVVDNAITAAKAELKQPEKTVGAHGAVSPDLIAAKQKKAKQEATILEDGLLFEAYHNDATGSNMFYNVGDAQWYFQAPDMGATAVSEAGVLDNLTQPEPNEWSPTSAVKVPTGYQKKLAEANPMFKTDDKKTLNSYIAEHGGSYAVKMTTAEKHEWIRWDLAGNELAKYGLEYYVTHKPQAKKPLDHKLEAIHPGSKKSDPGLDAYVAFANLAAVRDWGPFYTQSGPGAAVPVSEWPLEALRQFVDDLNLYRGREVNGVPLSELQPEDWGVKELRPIVDEFIARVPGESLPPPNILVEEPVWKEPTVAKPNGVTESTWDFVTALEVYGDDPEHVLAKALPSLVNMPDGVKSHLQNHVAAFQAILQAPPSVQLAYAWALGGLDSGYVEFDPPSDLKDAIEARILAGYYSEVETPAQSPQFFTFPGTTTSIELAPGDTVWEAEDGNIFIFHSDGTNESYKKGAPSGAMVADLAGPKPVLLAAIEAGAPTAAWSGHTYTKIAGTGGYTINFDDGTKVVTQPGDKVFKNNDIIMVIHSDKTADSYLQHVSAGEYGGSAAPAKPESAVIYAILTGENKSWEQIWPLLPKQAGPPEQNGMVVLPTGEHYVMKPGDALFQMDDTPVQGTKAGAVFVVHVSNPDPLAQNPADWLSGGMKGKSFKTQTKPTKLGTTSKPYVAPTYVAPKEITLLNASAAVKKGDLVLPKGDSAVANIWITLENVEKHSIDWAPSSVSAMTPGERDTYLLSHGFSQQFVDDVPPQVKAWTVSAHMANFEDHIAVLKWKASSGAYGFKTPAAKSKLTDPSKAYASQIAKGNISAQAIADLWTLKEEFAFIEEFGLPEGLDTQQVSPLIAAKILEISNQSAPAPAESEPEAPPTGPLGEPLWDKLTFKQIKVAKTVKIKGGSHSLHLYEDQYGTEYLTKSFPNDPQPLARQQTEDAMNDISRIFGFRAPPTTVRDMPSIGVAYVQKLEPDSGNMTGRDPSTLPQELLTEVLEEHVLDFLISNHDSYHQNLLISADGKHILGIDKGQALKFFGSTNDTFDIGTSSKLGNPINAYYDDVYAAIISKKIPKETVDKAVLKVLRRARRMQLTHDEEFHERVTYALGERVNFPSNFPNADAMTSALMARKAGLGATTEEFWKKVYSQAGYDWPFPPIDQIESPRIETDRGSAFTGFTQELFDQVAQTQVHGTPTFFAGEDIEDAHFLAYEEKTQGGDRLLVLEGRMRTGGNVKIMNWLSTQDVTVPKGAPKTDAGPHLATMPGSTPWMSTIIKAAQTVNHHASDGEYNQSTLAELESVKKQITDAKAYFDIQADSHPGEVPTPQSGSFNIANTDWPPGTFKDYKHVEAYRNMLDTYLGYIDEIEKAKNESGKTPNKNYAPYTYVPPPEPQVVEQWEGGTDYALKLDKLDDGTWKFTDTKTDIVQILPAAEGQKLIDEGGWTQGSGAASAEDSVPVTIFKRKNARTSGKYDFNNGTLLHAGGDVGTGTPGEQLAIEVGDNTTIEYQPHDGYSAVPAQRGLMRIKVDGWTGDIEELTNAMNQLKSMGVEFTPADETQMELFYWRHFYGVSKERASVPTAVKEMQKRIENWRANHPNPSPEAELAEWRSAWEIYLGKEKVENAPWMPQLLHQRIATPTLETGHPYWLRPDATPADLKNKMASHTLYGGHSAAQITKSGGLLATEERLRFYGQWVQGTSSTADQGSAKGSSAFLFTHPTGHGGVIWLRPEVYLRTSTYAYGGDHYGSIHDRKSDAPFTAEALAAKGGEMMVKYALSLFDDIVMFRMSGSDRAAVLAFLKEHGITTIRGVPIEERFPLQGGVGEAKKLLAKELAWRKANPNAPVAS